MTTLIHLVRHAPHSHVGRVLTGRLPGHDLTPEGRWQAADLARRLAREHVDAVFSSPRRRARQTAETIAEACDAALEITPALDEIDFGPWAGRSFAELEADPYWRRWNAQRDTAHTPAGDCMADVAERVLALVGNLHARFPDGRLVLVSHSDVIKAALCKTAGLSFAAVHQLDVPPASVTTLAMNRGAVTPLAAMASPSAKPAAERTSPLEDHPDSMKGNER